MTDQFLSMSDAASRLRISERHLAQLITSDAGPRVTIVEGEQHVQIDDLVTWIADQEKPAGAVRSTISTREFVSERFLTIREAAERAGMSPHVLERRLKKKLGPAVEHYRGWPVIRPDHLTAWLATVECFGQTTDHDLDPAWGKSPRHSASIGE